jgi:hypothetical protein
LHDNFDQIGLAQKVSLNFNRWLKVIKVDFFIYKP